MSRLQPLCVAISIALLVAAQTASAQLVDPNRTRSTTQVVQPPPPPPPPPPRPIVPAQPLPPPAMPTQLGQRPQPAPISAPAQATPTDNDQPARRLGAQPAKVYDRHGRVLEGMQQAGPNRVLDTRTGRYYDTVPAGDGQRIQPAR